VLLAPFVQHDAPTARPDAGGWARVLTRRVIGLAILNAVGVRALNHLPVIQFRFPASVLDGPLGGTATRAYSYRLNTGFAPRRDWGRDVAALPPYLLVAGARDEAFVADAYASALAPHNPGGTFVVLDGVGHLGVVDAPATFDALRGYLETLG
jgi:pimeloyl-ACP methyl ester carboxylesterase